VQSEKSLLLFDDFLVFLGNLFPEVGVYLLDSLWARDLLIVDIPTGLSKKDLIPPVNCTAFSGPILRALDLVLRCDWVKTKTCEELLTFLGQKKLNKSVAAFE